MNDLKAFCESLPTRIKWYGRLCEEPVELSLRAGKLKMIFRNGALRYISSGRDELIRMIYPAVRGKDWITVMPLISDEIFDIKSDKFRIKYTSTYISEEINFTARFEIDGNHDNSLSLSMEGIANRAFLKNRIGFCILHPIENYIGIPCNIEHSDGSSEQSFFPEEISPHQVFRDIRSMNWQIHKVNCSIDLEGEVFETEDQRNWTDASFKTYSTPLSIPYPVLLEKGVKIYQRIRFRADGLSGIPRRQKVDKTVVKLYPEKQIKLPSVGICRSDRPSHLNKEETEILKALDFDHYRIDLNLFSSSWKERADIAHKESIGLGWPLEFALFIDDNSEVQIKNFINWYYDKNPSVSSILLYHKSLPSTPDPLARRVIPLLKEVNPHLRIATGTNANFAQLNRNRPGDTGNDCICYSVHPQEHASDNQTLVENLKAQEYSVGNARKFTGNKGIIVSPVTLQRRFNANKTMIELPWTGHGLPPHIDNRMMSLFGACWTAGSLKYLCEVGADSITVHYTTGERGIIQGESESRWPAQYPSFKGMIFPVYYVLKYLLDHKDLHLIKSISSKPLKIDCLSLTDGKQVHMIMLNFTRQVESLRLESCSGLFSVRSLNTDTYSEAASNCQWTREKGERIINSYDEIKLEPYSINFIKGCV